MSLNVVNPFKFKPLPVGGWKLLARISGDGTSTNLTVSSLADKRYYQILGYVQPSTGNVAPFPH